MTTPAPCSNPNCNSATAEWWNHRTGERVCVRCAMGYMMMTVGSVTVTRTYEAIREEDCRRAKFDALAFTIFVRTPKGLQ